MKLSVLFLSIAFFSCIVLSVKQTDRVSGPPGMQNTTVFSGYLETNQGDRKLHYVFVQAENNPDTAPLALWLNGGPGCSSLIGYMQEIGPYLVGDTYKFGQPLIKNPYRWNRAANIMFIQSPGLIGFSTDKNPNISYSDRQTADDSFYALKDFIWNVAPQFKNRSLYLTGQSYAGKYIPDIVVRILDHNRLPNATYINLKGILIGNGIMNHVDHSLLKSKIQFMAEHDFISERLMNVYRASCEIDWDSPRCQYFWYEFELLREQLNTHNVYEVCQQNSNSIEQIRTYEAIRKLEKQQRQIRNEKKYGKNLENPAPEFLSLTEINSCPIDDGMIDYLNMYRATYHVEGVNKTWEPCSDINYDITVEASMEQYKQIFANKAVKVWMFSGDWDDVVAYPDTLYNLKLLRRRKIGNQEPWFVGEIHAGYYQVWDSVTTITVKGAGHWVPIFKPAAAYQMFYNFINDKPINTPV